MNPLCLQSYGEKRQTSWLPLPGSLDICWLHRITQKNPDGLILNMLHEGEMTSAMLLQIVGLFSSSCFVGLNAATYIRNTFPHVYLFSECASLSTEQLLYSKRGRKITLRVDNCFCFQALPYKGSILKGLIPGQHITIKGQVSMYPHR